MNYAAFKKAVLSSGWTVAQLRCDVPPTADILDLMDVVGLNKYEKFVLKFIAEGGK